MMLRAGVPAAEVARRLGHSVDILMRVYAAVFDDERQRSNELIDRAVKGTPRKSGRHIADPRRAPIADGLRRSRTGN
jgi:hypothetical protein